MKNLTLLFLLACISFNLRAYVPGNDRNIDADSIGVLNSTYVTLRDSVDLNSNDIFGINNLTVTGTTTLNVLLNGPLKATAGVVSSSAIDLASGEVTGTLPIANGGTNSNTALTNDKVMVSTAGSIVESLTTTTQLSYLDATSSIQTQLDGKEPTLPWTTTGDLLFYNVSPQRLGVGTEGQLLTVSSGLPSWQDAPISTTLDTKGQLQGFSTVNANVGPCADDQILVYDSLEATGWKCSVLPSTSPTTTLGDLIYNNTGTAAGDTRLGIGTEGQLLTVNSGVPAWLDAPVSTTLTTKGDIQTFDTANARLPVGSDGAFLVADSNETTGLKWADTISGSLNPVTDWEAFTPTGSWTTNTTYTGRKRQVGDTMEYNIKVSLSGAPNTAVLVLNIPDGTIDTTKFLETGWDTFGTANLYQVGVTWDLGRVMYNNTSSVRVSPFADHGSYESVGQTDQNIPFVFGTGDWVTVRFSVPLIGLTSGVDAAITNKQLTALTSNRLTGTLVNVNGSYAFEDFQDKSYTVTKSSTGIGSIDYSSLGLTSAPNLIGLYEGGTSTGNIRQIEFRNITATGADYDMKARDDGNVNTVFFDGIFAFNLIKTGNDVNKSSIIAGTFENINSTNLAKAEIYQSADQIIPFNSETALTNLSNTEYAEGGMIVSTNSITVPRTGKYRVSADSGGLRNISASVAGANSRSFLTFKINGGSETSMGAHRMGAASINTLWAFDVAYRSVTVTLNAGDVLNFYLEHNYDNTASNVEATGIRIAVIEEPDYEAIVKNLYANQTKCQRKYLSANVSADGAIADLSFSNLTVGKKYRLIVNYRMFNGGSDQFDLYYSNVTAGISTMPPVAGSPSFQATFPFTATATTITANAAGLSTAVIYGGVNQTWAYLCQLPDSYIETTEW